MRPVLVHGLEAEEGLGLELGGAGGVPAEDGIDELLERLRAALDVGDALVKGGEAGEGFRSRCLRGENGDKAVGRVGDGAAQAELDLSVDPVHHAAAADVDGKRGGAVSDHVLELTLPGLARAEIVLVEPDVDPGGHQASLQYPCGLGIDAGVAEEEQR